ncbi:MAG: alpha/beta hydrolase, partial [Candidatus Odinarchaeota archaeon]
EIKLPSVKVNDINIYYEVHGEGYPLVLIRGLSSSLKSWPPYSINQFSKSFKTILFDNRGAGRTDIPDGDYSAKIMADDTIGLMNALDINKAHILGFSMGGCIAQEIILNYPKRVAKLILTSSWCGPSHGIMPNPEENPFPKMTPLLQEGNYEQMAKILTDSLFPEYYKKNNPRIIEKIVENYINNAPSLKGFQGQSAYVDTFDTFDRLSEIKSSTLILHGTEDKILPVENAKILARKILTAELVLFENTGHGMNIQENRLWTQKVIDFLKKD